MNCLFELYGEKLERLELDSSLRVYFFEKTITFFSEFLNDDKSYIFTGFLIYKNSLDCYDKNIRTAICCHWLINRG